MALTLLPIADVPGSLRRISERLALRLRPDEQLSLTVHDGGLLLEVHCAAGADGPAESLACQMRPDDRLLVSRDADEALVELVERFTVPIGAVAAAA
mgnify:CR=1 FL=1